MNKNMEQMLNKLALNINEKIQAPLKLDLNMYCIY